MMKRLPRGDRGQRCVRALTPLLLLGVPLSAQGADRESALLTEPRQLTFEGQRAGEGYYSRDGSMMVFQSEREPGNPFYQIYLLDLVTGDVDRVSPGHGKTTCAWIHPDKSKVVYASTHLDPEARAEQQEEIDLRESGQQRRYAWDYDDYFDLFAWDRASGENVRLTYAQGYDAEGSYSPDGEWICFASNRAAFLEPMSDEDRKRFEVDKSLFMDLYMMRSDGREVRRLTFARGYDGGPFFNHDGTKICWRRFSENGLTAEVWTMNVDGSGKRQLTEIGAMSWAPYFHPSGEYLIFTTNRHGFGNFELYLVDADGAREPVRVTYTDGFDGLPTFTPDGRTLAWTTNRTASKQSQIYIAQWNHEAALSMVRGSPARGGDAPVNRPAAATDGADAGEVRVEDLRRHVTALCGDEMAGRLTGSEGEQLATQYVADCFQNLGLAPGGDDGGWFQSFRGRMLDGERKMTNVTGRNVIGILRSGMEGGGAPLIIGAHVDHLGVGGSTYSLAPKEDRGQLHRGADDNASGVAGLLEIAEYLTSQVADGKLKSKRDIWFAAWSGEEIGLFGSKHFVKAAADAAGTEDLADAFCAYLNLDMIGRFDGKLILSGIGSSPYWRREIERRNAPLGISLSLVEDVHLPTDTSAFYPKKVPILNAFTGAHEDYHRPTDTVDKLVFPEMQRATKLMALIARGLARSTTDPEYTTVVQEEPASRRSGGRPYLGTIPDYGWDGGGVLMDGTAEGGPAWKAGIRGGDIIVELNGRAVDDIYVYTEILEELQPDVDYKVIVERDGKRLELTLTPGRRG